MGKHAITAWGMYGDVSHRLSYEIAYLNNQLRPTILASVADILGFQRIIADRIYYEEQRSYSLGFNYVLPAPDALDKSHLFFLGAQYRSRLPWNSLHFQFVPFEQRPIAANLLTLAAKYDYFSPGTQTGITATHTNKKLGSDLTMTRLRAFFDWQLPFDESHKTYLALILHGAMQEGDELPQDFLGFQKYDQFEGGVNLVGLQMFDRIRGIRRYYPGNRLLHGALEFRQEDHFFGDLVPIIGALKPQLIEFAEMGTSWYGTRPTNHPDQETLSMTRRQWLKSAGVELRAETLLGVAIGGGVAWELVKRAQPDWYFRFTSEF
jgi:hypothetical protein